MFIIPIEISHVKDIIASFDPSREGEKHVI